MKSAAPGFTAAAVLLLAKLFSSRGVSGDCIISPYSNPCQPGVDVNYEHESGNSYTAWCCIEEDRCGSAKVKFCKKDGEMEVYREQHKKTLRVEAMCCTEDTENLDFFKTKGTSCRETKCVPKGVAAKSKNLCGPGLDKTLTVNNTEEIDFIEVMRDDCNDADGMPGSPGMAAVCCMPGTLDTSMTTLHGAEPKEFPFFARIANVCGGMIYNERWVLTASHCVVNQEEGVNRPYDKDLDGQETWDENVGSVRLNIGIRDATSKHTYNVTEIHVHPESSYLHPNGYSINDLALLKLDRDIEFGEDVKAIRFAKKGFNALDYGDHALIMGFGDTDTKLQPTDRRKANLVIREDKDVSNFPQFNDQMLYVGGIYNGITSPMFGKGDSGGPLSCRDKDGHVVLCGVAGFMLHSTKDCVEDPNSDNCYPVTYVEVQHFHDWLNSVAGGQENAELLDNQFLYGEAAKTGDFPGHVHIKTSRDSCGGTYVGDDVVITAASCVVDDGNQLKDGVEVYTGVMDLKKGGGTKLEVKDYKVMDGFKKVSRSAWGGGRKKRVTSVVLESWQMGQLDSKAITKDPFYKNNVALLKLSKASGLGGKVPQLATKSSKTGDMAMEIAYPLKGLGKKSNGKIPLTKREFKLLDRKTCQKRIDRLHNLDYDAKIDSNVVCGVEWFSGGSMCDRELGGGLYCKGSSGRYDVLCGVQVGRLCEFNIPNEFIDITKIGSWVNGQLKSF